MAEIKSKVTLNTKNLSKLKKRLEAANNQIIQAGHFDNKPHTDTGQSIAEIGFLNHEGFTTGFAKVPSRPYIEKALQGPNPTKSWYEKEVVKIAEKLMTGDSNMSKEAKLLGRDLQNAIRSVIENPGAFGIEPNSPTTVALKGTNAPLQDTTTLLDDVTFRTFKKGVTK